MSDFYGFLKLKKAKLHFWGVKIEDGDLMAIWRGLVGESDGDNFNGFVVEVVIKGKEANVDLDIVVHEGVLLLVYWTLSCQMTILVTGDVNDLHY